MVCTSLIPSKCTKLNSRILYGVYHALIDIDNQYYKFFSPNCFFLFGLCAKIGAYFDFLEVSLLWTYGFWSILTEFQKNVRIWTQESCIEYIMIWLPLQVSIIANFDIHEVGLFGIYGFWPRLAEFRRNVQKNSQESCKVFITSFSARLASRRELLNLMQEYLVYYYRIRE